MSVVRKSAILLLSLGHRRAKQVLARMQPQQVDQVAGSIKQAADASWAEVNQVLSDFYQQRLSQLGGIVTLNHLSAAVTAQLLSTEHPQAATLVLMQIRPRSHAAAVLQAMPSSLQQALALRMASLEHVSPLVLKDVNRSLKKRLKPPSLSLGLESLGQILQNMKPAMATRLLGKISTQSSSEAQSVQLAQLAQTLKKRCPPT